MAYLGFKKLESKIAAKGGVRNPGAVAASIGRAKYGKKAFQQHAAEGKAMRGLRAAAKSPVKHKNHPDDNIVWSS